MFKFSARDLEKVQDVFDEIWLKKIEIQIIEYVCYVVWSPRYANASASGCFK
jgi:hypothetical protein